VNVLFVCVANSGRSVMAERLFREAAHGRHQARSAGSEPGKAPHPQVVEALREVGIDASDHVPRKLDQEALDWADVAVSTCTKRSARSLPASVGSAGSSRTPRTSRSSGYANSAPT
jgi:protein-tyrosine-phosphatase